MPILNLALFTWKCIDGTVFSKENDTYISWIATCSLISAFTIGSYLMHIRYEEEKIVKKVMKMDDQSTPKFMKRTTMILSSYDNRRKGYGYRGKHGQRYDRSPGSGPYRI